MKVTQELLKEVLHYEAKTGKLYWEPRPAKLFGDWSISEPTRDFGWTSESLAKSWNTRFAGKEAGVHTDKDGYRVCKIFDVSYRAHRVIWFREFGVWPEYIDHINGDPADNRLDNMRDVGHDTNTKNKRKMQNNTSGVTGVCWHKDTKSWLVRLAGRHIGYFQDFDQAVLARMDAMAGKGYTDRHGM